MFCRICYKEYKLANNLFKHYKKCIYDHYNINSSYIINFVSYNILLDTVYYIYCSIGKDTTLNDIDIFLKNKWFKNDKCIHTSNFYYNNEEYDINTKYSTISQDRIIYIFDNQNSTIVFIENIHKLNDKIDNNIKDNKIDNNTKDNKINVIIQNQEELYTCTRCDDFADIINISININHSISMDINCYKHSPNNNVYFINNSPRVGTYEYNNIAKINNKIYHKLIYNKFEQLDYGINFNYFSK